MMNRWPLLLLPAIGAAVPAHAEPGPRQIAAGVWLLPGKSSNVLVVPSDLGTLLVDAQRTADGDETLAAAARIGGAPVRYVINTHWHLDHSGGNGRLADAGAVVFAHGNVRVRRSTEQFMPAYNARIPAGQPASVPVVTYGEALDLFVGGERVELRHAPNAHTDGDTLVRLVHANVIHMGDIYFNGIWPFIDRASGGGIDGLIAAVDSVLARSDAKTMIVPGHGPLATREDLVRHRAMLADVRDKVMRGIRERKGREQIVASQPAAPWRSGMEGNEKRFVEAVFDSLAG